MRALTIAIAVATLSACKQHPDSSAADTPLVAGVRTAIVTREAFAVTVNAIGSVSARPDRYAALAAPGPTRVSRIFVVAGQRVAKGDSLIEFEHAPFDAAAQSASAALAGAERNAARAARLAQAGIIPQKDADQAAADLAAARAAEITAHRAQELATLRAPLAGVVTRMTAVMGSSVDAGQTLVEVADPSALDILFNVSPGEAGRIRVGDTLSLSGGESAGGEALGTGTVVSVGAAVDSASRAVAVRAHVTRAASRTLRIGESVFGRIVSAVHENAVTVPVEALVPEGDEYRVFIVDAGGIAHARPVKVGARSEAKVEILEGLEAGERVVTTGAYGVTDSTRVGTPKP